jgi:hypothetical protein
MIPQPLKKNAKMFNLLFFVFGVNQNVIDENHNEFIQFRHEHRVHEIHEVGRCIGETEGHNQIFI